MADSKKTTLELSRDGGMPAEQPVVVGRRRRELKESDIKRMNLGRAYWYANYQGIQDQQTRKIVKNFCTKIVQMVKEGAGLAIMGDAGVGKSGAAAVICKEAVRWGFTARVVSHEELQELRFEDRPYDPNQSMMDRVRAVEMLVVDNLNEDFMEDRKFGPRELEKLIQRRQGNRLSTVLTTRLGTALWAADNRLKSLWNLLKERTIGVQMEGDDLRQGINEILRDSLMGDEESK